MSQDSKRTSGNQTGCRKSSFFIVSRGPLDGERFKSHRGFFENQGNPAGSTIGIIGLLQPVEVGEPLDRLVSQLFRNRHHQRVY